MGWLSFVLVGDTMVSRFKRRSMEARGRQNSAANAWASKETSVCLSRWLPSFLAYFTEISQHVSADKANHSGRRRGSASTCRRGTLDVAAPFSGVFSDEFEGGWRPPNYLAEARIHGN